MSPIHTRRQAGTPGPAGMYLIHQSDFATLEQQICLRLQCETWDPPVLRTMHYREFRSRCVGFLEGRGGVEWGQCISLGSVGLVVMAVYPEYSVLEVELVDTLPTVTERPELLEHEDCKRGDSEEKKQKDCKGGEFESRRKRRRTGGTGGCGCGT